VELRISKMAMKSRMRRTKEKNPPEIVNMLSTTMMKKRWNKSRDANAELSRPRNIAKRTAKFSSSYVTFLCVWDDGSDCGSMSILPIRTFFDFNHPVKSFIVVFCVQK
jgi:hypothetical protein